MEILCLGSDTRIYFETFIEAESHFSIKSHTGEAIGQFSAGPLNKAVSMYRNSLTRVREG